MSHTISDIVMGDVHAWDYPDFCDAFIESCSIDGIPATDEQLDKLNEDRDFVYNEAVLSFH